MKKSKNSKIETPEQKVLDSMIKENPNIKMLIDLLNLQVVAPKEHCKQL